MKFRVHTHHGGNEKLTASMRREIEGAISACNLEPAKGAATKIGSAVLDELVKAGWSGEVTLARGSRITITSSKGGAGLCLQTGNMARMYADLLKLQSMFLNNAISVGVMIVPTRGAAKLLGGNVVHSDRLMRELGIFQKVIHMPLVVVEFE